MNAIEERSIEYSNSEYPQSKVGERIAAKCAYFTGATQQLEIDVEKACEWLKDFNHTYLEELGVGINTLLVIEDFKKAMKGE